MEKDIAKDEEEAAKDKQEADGKPFTHIPSASNIHCDQLFSHLNPRKCWWNTMKLVAPSTSLPPDKKGWKNKDAVCAYCPPCNETVYWISGETKGVKMHYEQYLDIHQAYEQRQKKTSPARKTLPTAGIISKEASDAVNETGSLQSGSTAPPDDASCPPSGPIAAFSSAPHLPSGSTATSTVYSHPPSGPTAPTAPPPPNV